MNETSFGFVDTNVMYGTTIQDYYDPNELLAMLELWLFGPHGNHKVYECVVEFMNKDDPSKFVSYRQLWGTFQFHELNNDFKTNRDCISKEDKYEADKLENCEPTNHSKKWFMNHSKKLDAKFGFKEFTFKNLNKILDEERFCKSIWNSLHIVISKI